MDIQPSLQLAKLVEELTTSGKASLDVETMKKVKKICRLSDEYVGDVFRLTMTQLDKEHSEIRLSAFQIMNELFTRSHCFRELLLADFQNFMELTIETDPDLPLPKPPAAAKELKRQCQEAIHQWHDKFGDAYKKLSLGYNYLKQCRKVNFADLNARSQAEQQRENERRQKQNSLENERRGRTLDDMSESLIEIQNCLLRTESCLELLLPDPESFHIPGLMSPEYEPGNPWRLKRKTSTEVDCQPSTSGYVCKPRGRHQTTDTPIKQETLEESCATAEGTGHSLQIKSEPVDADSAGGQTSGSCVTTAPAHTTGTTHSQGEEQTVICDSDNSEEFGEITDDDSDDDDESEEDTYDDRRDEIREHGLGSQHFRLSIEVNTDVVQLKETADNTDVLAALKEQCLVMENKYLPKIQKWLEALARYGGEQGDVKKVLDMKKMISSALEKVAKLKVTRMPVVKPNPVTAGDSDDEDDSDFEEVPSKEGYEPRIPDELREEYGLVEKPDKPATRTQWDIVKEAENFDEDPASFMATFRQIKEKLIKQEEMANAGGSQSESTESDSEIPSQTKQPAKAGPSGTTPRDNKAGISRSTEKPPSSSSNSSSRDARKAEKLKVAPVLPFSMDLMHWGSKDAPVPMVVRYEHEHRFWTPPANEDSQLVDQGALAERKHRVINFVGKFEPVKWACRAPLPTGKLCLRMDRKKCPFHGLIIPRDNMGNAVSSEDKARLIREEEKKNEDKNDWDDVELQADIEAATGVNITRKGKGRGKGKGKGKGKGNGRKRYPDLTDLTKHSNPRSRLEKKVLNKAAVKRVADTLDAFDSKRFRDKFANQFHYAYQNK